MYANSSSQFSNNNAYHSHGQFEMTDSVPALLLKHHIRDIRANHKHVKLCKAQCRLISRRLGVIYDVLQRMPNKTPSPGLLSAFQDACFILRKMTVTEEEEQSALQQGRANEEALQRTNSSGSMSASASASAAAASSAAMVKPQPPPSWLFMLRQRFICATIFNNFRQRLRKVWSLQPTTAWEEEDLKAQREDEEDGLKTLIEHAHIFDGTPMALPLLDGDSNNNSSAPMPRSSTTAFTNAADGDAESRDVIHMRQVDVDRLRGLMRRASTSSAWKLDPKDVSLPPNSYYSFEHDAAQQRLREKGLLDRRAEEKMLRRKLANGGGALGRQQLSSGSNINNKAPTRGLLLIGDVASMPTVMSPVSGARGSGAKDPLLSAFEGQVSPTKGGPNGGLAPISGGGGGAASNSSQASVLSAADECQFNHAEHQQRFRVYLNGTFQRVPYVALKELDFSLLSAASANAGPTATSIASFHHQMSFLTPPEVNPATMESFIIDITTRRGWCHPNLVDVIGGYAEILTESVDEATGLTELGAIPALGAVVEQLPTRATMGRRQQLQVLMREVLDRRKRERKAAAAAAVPSRNNVISPIAPTALGISGGPLRSKDTSVSDSLPNFIKSGNNALLGSCGASAGGSSTPSAALLCSTDARQQVVSGQNSNNTSMQYEATAAGVGVDPLAGTASSLDRHRTTNDGDTVRMFGDDGNTNSAPNSAAGSPCREGDGEGGATSNQGTAHGLTISTNDTTTPTRATAGRTSSSAAMSAESAALIAILEQEGGVTEEALAALVAHDEEAVTSSIPESWQSSKRLYSTLSEMLFSQHVRFTLVEIIDIARQIADALQYISFDADNVTAEILNTWCAVTPSNIYLREIQAESSETQLRDRLKRSRFEVRILPRFHVADGPVNRWDPPFDAESAPAYAIAQLMIAMVTRQPPFRTAESQLELVALLSGPAAVVKVMASQQQQVHDTTSVDAAAGVVPGLYDNNLSMNSLPPPSMPSLAAAASRASFMANSAASFVMSPTNTTSNLGHGGGIAVNQQQQQQHANGGQQGTPSPGLLPKGVEVPIGLPQMVQDLLYRCLLRRSDYVGDLSRGVPKGTADAILRGGGKVAIAELRQRLGDLFHSSEALMLDAVMPCTALYGAALDGMMAEGEEEDAYSRQQQQLMAAASGLVMGVGVDVATSASSLSQNGAYAHRRTGSTMAEAQHASAINFKARSSVGALLEYGTEPFYYQAYLAQQLVHQHQEAMLMAQQQQHHQQNENGLVPAAAQPYPVGGDRRRSPAPATSALIIDVHAA